MKLKTDIKIQEYPFKINLNTNILTIGSCFSDVLYDYLNENKLTAYNSNFGNTFNLFSISKILQNLISTDDPSKIIERDGVFYHYDLHSAVKSASKTGLILEIEKLQERLEKLLSEIDILTITLGTSWVYKQKKSDDIVANCHKQPAVGFEKLLMPIEKQILEFYELYSHLKIHNPKLKIILTVSPVRHIKDGIVENNLSKSILRVLCGMATSQLKHVYYFPSYEIMIDDLRDYRFYKEDLIHPNEQAERYILDLFKEQLFDNDLKDFVKVWASIKPSLCHIPFNTHSSLHQDFLKNTILKLEQINSIKDVSKEIEFIKNQLI